MFAMFVCQDIASFCREDEGIPCQPCQSRSRYSLIPGRTYRPSCHHSRDQGPALKQMYLQLSKACMHACYIKLLLSHPRWIHRCRWRPLPPNIGPPWSPDQATSPWNIALLSTRQSASLTWWTARRERKVAMMRNCLGWASTPESVHLTWPNSSSTLEITWTTSGPPLKAKLMAPPSLSRPCLVLM